MIDINAVSSGPKVGYEGRGKGVKRMEVGYDARNERRGHYRGIKGGKLL